MGASWGRGPLVLMLIVAVAVAAAATACDKEAPQSDDTLQYVAIGDSYTAAPWIPESSTDGCARSDHNYPHQVAVQLDDVELVDVSCGGATTVDVIRSQEQAEAVHPPQIDVVSEQTDLVTVGMGVNDLGYNYTASIECLVLAESDPDGSPCEDANARKLPAMLDRIQERVVGVVEAIRERASGASILLVGYPRLLPDSGGCHDRLPLADGDLAFVRDAFDRLNAVIEASADESGASYVDVGAASKGHDVCAREPWINGDRKDRRTKAAPYHPMPAEQAAVAGLILDLL